MSKYVLNFLNYIYVQNRFIFIVVTEHNKNWPGILPLISGVSYALHLAPLLSLEMYGQIIQTKCHLLPIRLIRK